MKTRVCKMKEFRNRDERKKMEETQGVFIKLIQLVFQQSIHKFTMETKELNPLHYLTTLTNFMYTYA